jgi:beta-lactamase class A
VVVAVVAAIASAQSFASAREGATTYLIQPGDTLSAIATTSGVSLDKLVGLNGLQDADHIVAGRTLNLVPQSAATPVGTPTTAGPMVPGGGGKYTIKDGDTLWDIAQSNGVSVDAVIAANALANADQLTVGQTLTLPPGAPPQRSAAATATPTPKPRPSPTVVPSPTAKPKPTGATGPMALQQKVASEIQRVGGGNARVGVAATNLVTGDKVSIRQDDVFPSASVMKLPILVELERQIAAGTLNWTESLRAEADAMISVSENTAADQIATAVRLQPVNDTLSRLGLGSTKFFNLFSDTQSPANPGQNQTTPANMARLLELIATDQIVNSQSSADIRSLLARNTDRSKLARQLPADAKIAHKSGWYDGVANDVGIVTVDRVPARWAIAVLAQNVPDAETGNQLIAAISKAVYDAWT